MVRIGPRPESDNTASMQWSRCDHRSYSVDLDCAGRPCPSQGPLTSPQQPHARSVADGQRGLAVPIPSGCQILSVLGAFITPTRTTDVSSKVAESGHYANRKLSRRAKQAWSEWRTLDWPALEHAVEQLLKKPLIRRAELADHRRQGLLPLRTQLLDQFGALGGDQHIGGATIEFIGRTRH